MDNRRYRQNRAGLITLLVVSAVVVAVVVPVSVYFGAIQTSRSTEPSEPRPRTSRTSTGTATSAVQTLDVGSSTQVVRTTLTTVTRGSSTTTETSTSSSVGSTVPEQDLEEIQRVLLRRHNELRGLHGSPNLTWNDELTRFAANYAANNFSCDNVQLIHSGGPYGENLAAGYQGGESPVNAWYDEISLYNYNDPGFAEATGHFTQLIWNTTLELGCAIVNCNNAWSQYTICEYYPMGNIVGSTRERTQELFRQHVPPLLDS
ncbi:CIC11C00000001045 [Sungouiella intermedia]|uniref:CIC11C00000001045 n=1 Tax=Sungouiella intermedia TaxID=45354 RepID=A0A1L0D9H5_9ASCO|nr:CIC11C00000001045 [[Candida] intermedia]